MTVKKYLENRVRGWLPKEPNTHIIEEDKHKAKLGKLSTAYNIALVSITTMTIIFPLAMYFFPPSVLPYFIITFITVMMGAGLVVMAGTLRFWGRIAVVLIVFGVLLGLITSLALH